MKFHCGECDAPCKHGVWVCPSCGSDNIRMSFTLPDGGIGSGPARALTFSVTTPGRRFQGTVKYVYSTKRSQLERVVRIFDKAEGKYHETCYGPDGEEVFSKHPDITDQSAHGERGRAAGAGQEHPFEAILRILPYLPPDHPSLRESSG
jgi:hypothetical protein